MKTGELIKQIRKQKHISAETIADRIGVHKATIYRYEKGDIEKIPYQVLVPIAEVLNVNPVDLLGIDKSEKATRLMTAFNLLTEEQQDALIVMAEGMIR